MERVELIKALISASGSIVGAIIGAIVAVAAIWAKEMLESRKASQNWFEQTYIAEGVDQLLAYLRLSDVLLTTLLHTRQTVELKGVGKFPDIENNLKSMKMSVLPVEALVRVETLLKTRDYTAVVANLAEFIRLFNNIEPEKRSFEMVSNKADLVRSAYLSLENIRQELLEIKIPTKKAAHKVHKNATINKILRQLSLECSKWSEKARSLST